MPRFFFHQLADGELVDDPDGSELPDLLAAREEALVAARELWAKAIIEQRDLLDLSFVIADGDGRRLLILPFADALPERLRR